MQQKNPCSSSAPAKMIREARSEKETSAAGAPALD